MQVTWNVAIPVPSSSSTPMGLSLAHNFTASLGLHALSATLAVGESPDLNTEMPECCAHNAATYLCNGCESGNQQRPSFEHAHCMVESPTNGAKMYTTTPGFFSTSSSQTTCPGAECKCVEVRPSLIEIFIILDTDYDINDLVKKMRRLSLHGQALYELSKADWERCV